MNANYAWYDRNTSNASLLYMTKDDLIRLAEIIRSRNDTESRIAEIIKKRGDKGSVGEYIASRIFGIDLAKSGRQKGYDGIFKSKPLTGSSVDVKFYPKQQWSIDINPKAWPDYFLILAGPERIDSKAHLWLIKSVYLFDARKLKKKLEQRSVKIGRATSVIQDLWHDAEIYPNTVSRFVTVTKEQRRMISLFH